MSEINTTDLNEAVEMVVEDAGVITTPIDATLSVSGAAADAKAVGDALELKADKADIQTKVKVNGQEADNQGLILVTGEHIPVSGEDETTLAAAVEELEGRTAEDIPISDEAGADSIADAIAEIGARTAEAIRMGSSDSRTVSAAIGSMASELTELAETVGGLDDKTAEEIVYRSGRTETVREHVDALDAAAVKSVNGIQPDTAGNALVNMVPYAENLYSEEMDQVDGEFIRRTTGGSGSLQDGSAWVLKIMGNSVHTGFTPESLQMTVVPMPRTAPAAITATLNEAVFEAFVEEAGTYTLSYDGTAWSATPADYGIAISNDPVDGDSISIVWDGVNNAVMTVNAAARVAPEAITASIDREVFVSYVEESTTITLTYTTAWSADPALYGITVNEEPIAGDQIVVAYVKEIRGTITTAAPTRLVGTGWNLYESANGYARVCRYSETYGYRIGGTWTALTFASSISGSRTAITPENGLFNVVGDGFVFVEGGDDTTYIYTTWSDWTEGYVGDFETYTESAVSLSGPMAGFTFGLCKVGSVRDEIDMNTKTAISRVDRMAYTAENLAYAAGTGRAYEYDENWIYIERAAAVSTAFELNEQYTISEHGLEFFDGAAVPVYAEIIYGVNLKDKLRRQVVAVTAQSFTSGQQLQARTNIGAASAADVSGNSQAIEDNEGAMAILATGDTHAAVTSGQFVYVRNHSTLADGLYKATAAIATDGALSTSNLTAVPSGGMNDLQGQVASLNSNFISVYDAFTPASGWSGDLRIARCGKQRIIYGALKPSNVGTSMVAYTLGESDRPPITIRASCSSYSLTAQSEISLGSDGRLVFNVPTGGNANNLVFNFLYFVQ